MRGLRLNSEEFKKNWHRRLILSRFLTPGYWQNQRTPKLKNFAREHNLPGTAGSDAHSIGEIGNVFVELADFHSPQEFIYRAEASKDNWKTLQPIRPLP